jgi:hypothetical protein
MTLNVSQSWATSGPQLRRGHIDEDHAHDRLGIRARVEPRDQPAVGVPHQDIGAWHLRGLEESMEVVDGCLGTGRLRHRVAAAGLLTGPMPQVSRRVSAGYQHHCGRSAAAALDVHHPTAADVDPLGEAVASGATYNRRFPGADDSHAPSNRLSLTLSADDCFDGVSVPGSGITTHGFRTLGREAITKARAAQIAGYGASNAVPESAVMCD